MAEVASMSSSRASATLERSPSSARVVRHLLLYDGACALCNGLTQFVLERDQRCLFEFASLQSAAARSVLEPFGASPDDLSTLYVLADYRGTRSRLLRKGRAVVFVMTALGWPWRAAALAGILPDAVLDRLYDLVARHRHRVAAGQRCLLPTPEQRSRFIDLTDDGRSTREIVP